MVEKNQTTRRTIIRFLSSLKYSIERAISMTHAQMNPEMMKGLLLVEEMRVRASIFWKYNPNPTSIEWPVLEEDLINFIDKFLSMKELESSILDLRFNMLPYIRSNEELKPPLFWRLSDRNGKFTIRDALGVFIGFLRDLKFEPSEMPSALSVENLNRIVPNQQVAPVQFDVINNRIVIFKSSPKINKPDRKNILESVEFIKNRGESLLQNLERSNCDRRLLDTVRDLQSEIDKNNSIVKIGLSNLACSAMGAQFEAEIPSAILAMFNSYTSSVSMYVAQFPEWDQFIQKAASIELDEDDVTDVSAAAAEVIDTLEKNPDLAEPEVPKTISFIRELLDTPGVSVKRATFAMIRTIENLVSSILKHSASFLTKTTEKSIEIGSTLSSHIIISLLSVAVIGASGIGLAAVRAGSPWVKQAAEIVEMQIKDIRKN